MDTTTASAKLAELIELKDRGRRRLGAVSYPLVLLGFVYLGAAPVVLVVHRDHLGPYFVVALAGVAIATAVHSRRRDHREGVVIARWPLLGTVAVMALVAATASRTGMRLDSESVSTIGPFLVNALFFLAFATATRSWLLFKIGVLLVAASLGSIGIARGDARVAIEAVLFAAIVFTNILNQRAKAGRS